MSASRKYLTDNEVANITNALRTAADEFVKHQAMFEDIASGAGIEGADMPPETAKRLADQFGRQIADVGALSAYLQAGVVIIEGEPEDFAEAEDIAKDCRIAAGLES